VPPALIWNSSDACPESCTRTIRASTYALMVWNTPAMTGLAAGSMRGSTSPASMPRSGKMRRRRTWSISPCSVTATTHIPPASATLRMSGLNGQFSSSPIPEPSRPPFFAGLKPRRVGLFPSTIWRRASRRALRYGQRACAGQWRRRRGSGEPPCTLR
jgi:hypothetical protein